MNRSTTSPTTEPATNNGSAHAVSGAPSPTITREGCGLVPVLNVAGERIGPAREFRASDG